MKLLGYEPEVFGFGDMEIIERLIVFTTVGFRHETLYEIVGVYGDMDT